VDNVRQNEEELIVCLANVGMDCVLVMDLRCVIVTQASSERNAITPLLDKVFPTRCGNKTRDLRWLIFG